MNTQTVLLTGASEGMGRSVARILASKGANVVIVARNVQKLEAALEHIKSSATSPTQRFHYFSADVTKSSEATRIIDEVTAWNDGAAPDVVWCIAGGAHPTLFLETTPEKLRQQMDMNYWSCADMAHAILAQWLHPSKIQETPRHLIFTSSVLAFYPIVGYIPYSPAKAALRSLSDTLNQELKLYSSNIKVHTVFPGSIMTPGFAEENKIKPAITQILEKDDPVQTADEVAEKSIKGLERGEYLITVGLLGTAMRGSAWSGSPRNNWLVDSAMAWVTSIAWPFIQWDLDGKVAKYGKEHGHPSTYPKH